MKLFKNILLFAVAATFASCETDVETPQLGNITDGRLAAGRHVALADDGDEFLCGDFVEFLIGFSGDGDGQGIYKEAGLLGLGGIIKGGSVSDNTNHSVDSSLSDLKTT